MRDRRDGLRRIALAAALLLPAAATPATIDPLRVAHQDFARNRDPRLWEGFAVSRIAFEEDGVAWRLWRIANNARPDGPLWVVPHDDEDAAFDAALLALRSWGGVLMAVDADGWRRHAGRDPNRNFDGALPRFAQAMLADLQPGSRLIVALHTNAPGFDPALARCGTPGSGAGSVSVRLCTERLRPRASRSGAWPFDDEDSLVLLPHRPADPPGAAFCARRLAAADFNLVFERVQQSDRSLSNYAALRGLRYVNIETRDRGRDPRGMAEARARALRMVDLVMERCGDLPARIHPPPDATAFGKPVLRRPE